MPRRYLIPALVLAGALFAAPGLSTARAQDWTNFYHWPYVPPQNPGSGFQYNTLHDGWYLYPKEQRIVPQIQGPYYRNFYGGKLLFGKFRVPNNHGHDWSKAKYYKGNHFILDVF